MTRPRLLILASTYPARPGDGIPAFVRDLALQEAEAFEVRVVAPRVPGGALAEEDGPLTVRRFRYFPRRWESLAHGAILDNLRARPARSLQLPGLVIAEWWAVRRELRRFRPDLIHAHWILPQGLVARYAARTIPTLVTTLGGDLYALNFWPARSIKRGVLRRAGAVTVMNEDMRERAITLGASPERTLVMPMGADLADVAAVAATRQAGRIPVILMVGRLVQKKGVAVLLDALALLPPGIPWRAVVVGDGPERKTLEARAAGLPVTFLGQLGRGDLLRAYSEADLAVFPSIRAASGDQDGLPVALIEAMGAGLAIIASELPGLTETVQTAGAGIIVPSGDAAALSAAIASLLADSEERKRLGLAASYAAAAWGIDRVGEGYRALLLSLLKPGRPVQER